MSKQSEYRRPNMGRADRCHGCAEHPLFGGERKLCRFCARNYFDRWKSAVKKQESK